MDANIPNISIDKTYPLFLDKTNQLISVLNSWSISDFKSKMKTSDSISLTTFETYKNWNQSNINSGIPAVYLYSGTAFKGLSSINWNNLDLDYAQNNLIILSGLYGFLRPLDLIHKYRLEMALKFDISKDVNSLYKFWSHSITTYFNENFSKELIVNLASNEYFKVIDEKVLETDILNCHFLEVKNGTQKSIASHAKRARGLFARFIVKNKLKHREDLKLFDLEGYKYRDDLSNENNYFFSRIH
jgi:hypothetical protein